MVNSLLKGFIYMALATTSLAQTFDAITVDRTTRTQRLDKVYFTNPSNEYIGAKLTLTNNISVTGISTNPSLSSSFTNNLITECAVKIAIASATGTVSGTLGPRITDLESRSNYWNTVGLVSNIANYASNNVDNYIVFTNGAYIRPVSLGNAANLTNTISFFTNHVLITSQARSLDFQGGFSLTNHSGIPQQYDIYYTDPSVVRTSLWERAVIDGSNWILVAAANTGNWNNATTDVNSIKGYTNLWMTNIIISSGSSSSFIRTNQIGYLQIQTNDPENLWIAVSNSILTNISLSSALANSFTVTGRIGYLVLNTNYATSAITQGLASITYVDTATNNAIIQATNRVAQVGYLLPASTQGLFKTTSWTEGLTNSLSSTGQTIYVSFKTNFISSEIDPIWTSVSNSYVNANDWKSSGDPMGFPDMQVDRWTQSFTDSSRTFSNILLTTSADYFYKGSKYTYTNSASIAISTNVGTHYIYMDDATGTLKDGLSQWNFSNNVQVATVYWNGQNGFLGYELHRTGMAWAQHELEHVSDGSRFGTGFTPLTAAVGSFSLASGTWYDEDIKYTVSAVTRCSVVYHTNSAYMVWSASSVTPYLTNSTANDILFDNLTTTQIVASGNYVAYWIVSANSTSSPIVSIMGQREDTTLANAVANNTFSSLNLSSYPSAELKPLYRLIYHRASGTGILNFDQADDYRLDTLVALRTGISDGDLIALPIATYGSNGVVAINLRTSLWERAVVDGSNWVLRSASVVTNNGTGYTITISKQANAYTSDVATAVSSTQSNAFWSSSVQFYPSNNPSGYITVTATQGLFKVISSSEGLVNSVSSTGQSIYVSFKTNYTAGSTDTSALTNMINLASNTAVFASNGVISINAYTNLWMTNIILSGGTSSSFVRSNQVGYLQVQTNEPETLWIAVSNAVLTNIIVTESTANSFTRTNRDGYLVIKTNYSAGTGTTYSDTNYSISYGSYPKLTLTTNMFSATATAGTLITLKTFTNALDTSFTTITSTGSVSGSADHAYLVDLGDIYAGYFIFDLVFKNGAVNSGISFGSGNQGTTSAGLISGAAGNQLQFPDMKFTLGTYTNHYIRPFVGRYLGIGFDFGNAACSYWFRDFSVYGFNGTLVYTNFAGAL